MKKTKTENAYGLPSGFVVSDAKKWLNFVAQYGVKVLPSQYVEDDGPAFLWVSYKMVNEGMRLEPRTAAVETPNRDDSEGSTA